jgi:hypothetical protein
MPVPPREPAFGLCLGSNIATEREFDVRANRKPPPWFWLVSALGLAWNLIGVAAFINDLFFLDPSTLNELQREFYQGRPGWATAAYGVAVFGGALGCLALLLRRSWALPMLLVCLLGIVLQNVHALVLGNGIDVFGPAGLALPLAVFVIAVFLAWFAHYSRGRGWLR